MRRGRILILLAFILLLGALALFLLLRGLGGGAPAEPEAEGTPAPFPGGEAQIVIAAQDISRGAEIPSDGVILSPFPADFVVETMVTDLEQVIGRRARMDIARGVPITTGMITEEAGDLLGTGSDAAIAIPSGYTAISIPMTRLSGVAFALRDGDQVDVIIAMTLVDLDPDFQTILPNETGIIMGAGGTEEFPAPTITSPVDVGDVDTLGRVIVDEETEQLIYVVPSERQRPRLVTQRLIENATVLHVGTFPLPEEELAGEVVPVPEQGVGAPPPEGQQAAPPEPPKPDVVTLIVSPQDALALNWAMKAGADLILTLRGPDDGTTTETTSVTLQYLVENYGIAVPSKLPYGIEPRIDAPVQPVLPNDVEPATTP